MNQVRPLGVTRQNEKTDEFVFVTDLTPTILNLAGAETHAGSWNGKAVEQIIGKGFSGFLNAETESIHDETTSIGYELGGNQGLFKGDYKIVFNLSAPADRAWHLFNIKTDPGETNDLAEAEPARFAQMRADFENYVRDNNVLPMPEGYVQGRQVFRGGLQ